MMNFEILRMYEVWIDGKDSDNTKLSYKNGVNGFFAKMFNKKIDNISAEDLASITPVDFNERYMNALKKEGKQNSTIKYNITVIKSFFEQLRKNKYGIDIIDYDYLLDVVFNTKSIRSDKKHTTPLSEDNYYKMQRWLIEERFGSNPRYARTGKGYALVLRFMWETATRLTATFNVQWKDIKFDSDSLGNKGYTLRVLDKGEKLNVCAISPSLYMELKNFLKPQSEEECIFNEFNKNVFGNLFRDFSKVVGENLSPHSIKAGAVTYLYNMTKDPVLTQRFANHSNFNTTLGYIDNQFDRTTDGGTIISTDVEKIQRELIDKFTLEELGQLLLEDKELIIKAYSKIKERKVIKNENVNIVQFA